MTPSLHIGIPLHDGRIHEECMRGVLETWGRWPCSLTTVRGSFLPRSRDLIVDGFVRDAATTHLLCVDSDMEWHAEDLAKLLALDAPFAFGGYVAKHDDGALMASRLLATVDLGDGVEAQQYDRCGAGFMLLRRDAIEQLLHHYAEERYRDAAGRELIGLWQTSGRVELDGVTVAEGEDYAFCRRWRALGGAIVTRTDVRLGHVGSRVYS